MHSLRVATCPSLVGYVTSTVTQSSRWQYSIEGGHSMLYSSPVFLIDFSFIIKLYKNDSYDDGMIIKYSSEGEVEWATSFGGSSDERIYSVSSTRDGGCIVGGYFRNSIQVGDYTLTNNGDYDGMLIKYSSDGEVEWAKEINGNKNGNQYPYSVIKVSDGGYIVVGEFGGNIELENREILNSNGSYNGMIIKYDTNNINKKIFLPPKFFYIFPQTHFKFFKTKKCLNDFTLFFLL